MIRRRSGRTWAGSLFFTASGIFFLWIGLRAIQLLFVWPHYHALVGACFGGSGNLCDVVVHTQLGDVESKAYLDTSHPGQEVIIAAPGSPPWQTVQLGEGGWGWVVLVLGLGGGVLGILGGLYILVRPPTSRNRVRHSHRWPTSVRAVPTDQKSRPHGAGPHHER
jgi:hypothetical protein